MTASPKGPIPPSDMDPRTPDSTAALPAERHADTGPAPLPEEQDTERPGQHPTA
jgi:hypothetical protein